MSCSDHAEMTHPSTGLLTDLYHVDAAFVAWRAGLSDVATFDLYTRSLPFGGGFLLVAGLEQALIFARDFRYSDDDIAFLASVKSYEPAFLRYLRDLRFTGEIVAIREGSVAFAHEPLLRVTAPLSEALLLESGLLHAVSLATLIATKAARIVWAAAGRPVTEFAYRRAQAPFVVARSAAIGGCVATSFVAAAEAFGLPVAGTIPHALVQAFPTEADAFRAIADTLERYTLLLDTYNPRRAIHTAVATALSSRERTRHELTAVRLDSGDLIADSVYLRCVLDQAGLTQVNVLASGDLDEYRIDALLRDRAPIDGFGVGTSLGVGAGLAARGIEGGALGAVYKLVQFGTDSTAAGRIKLAGPKSTWPGVKQVYRTGTYEGDVIALTGEPPPAGAKPLLSLVMQEGRMTADARPPLTEILEYAAANLAALPERYRSLTHPAIYPVAWSRDLQLLRARTREVAWQGAADAYPRD